MNNLFILSEKDLIKLSIMMLLAAIGFGVPGLVMMIILQWMTRQSYAKDSVDKHGISSMSASRLGGAAVVVCSAILLVVGWFAGLGNNDLAPRGLQFVAWSAVFICLGLGLLEDLRNDSLSPRFRLLAEFVVFAVLIALMPSLIPAELGVWGLDALIALPVIGGVLTVIFCVGFINAVNMADGANGLMPGILTISFGLFYAETGAYSYACLMTSCGLFTIFNVISGRLFLGDAGSYGLGAALCISGLFLYSQGDLSASFLAVLLAYPCIDMLMALARRSLQGRSLLSPDNDHLHNRIHFQLQKRFRSPTLANSLTGSSIVMASSGIALMGYQLEWLAVTSQLWSLVFGCQCFAYGLVFYLTGLGRSVSQHVVDA
jgi:UDP-GlcNAc:undecaprenyl-phosphate GlcNAc-1-phosphate transferase